MNLHPIGPHEVEDARLLKQQLERAQRFLHITLALSDLAAAAKNLEEFIEKALELICREMNRQVATAWQLDSDRKQLRCHFLVDLIKIETAEFVAETEQARFVEGEGLSGLKLCRAHQRSGFPIWRAR